MKILITGSSGYIGSCLNNLLNEKISIYGIDKNRPNEWTTIKKNNFYTCNLLDKKKLEKIISKIMPDTVIHLAAQSTVDEKISKKEYFTNNVTTTKNLIAIMSKFQIKNIIFSSTAAVYDKNPRKINENYRLKPISKYGKSKLQAEIEIKKELNIKHIILRFFNVSSSIPKLKIGELHKPETHLIPISVTKSIKGETISIYGNNYSTNDGTCIRDYVHIKDICLAIIKSKNYLKNKRSKSSILNIGNGKGISNSQILSSLQKILKRKIKVEYSDRRKGDQPFLVCNINKAKQLIKWKPENSKINKILKDEIEWTNFLIKKNVNRKF